MDRAASSPSPLESELVMRYSDHVLFLPTISFKFCSDASAHYIQVHIACTKRGVIPSELVIPFSGCSSILSATPCHPLSPIGSKKVSHSPPAISYPSVSALRNIPP